MTEPPFSPLIRAPLQAGGWLVGKWRIERVLGAGGMGVIYEARHRNGNRVAVKILHPELVTHADILRRFLREGLLANAVEHPGVVKVLDDGVTEQGVPFLVMELLSGENLDARLSRIGGPLSLPDALSVGVAMLDALAAAHEVGIIHRDIKPENVFLTASGVVKLLDFGIAFLLDAMNGMSSTRPGITVGTPTFMPREQAQGLTALVDSQSDLWSVGATLFYALTHEFLYAASTAQEFVAKLVDEPPRPLRSLAPDVPEAIAAVIDKALEHDRQKRWKSAPEMQKALVEAALASGVSIPAFPSLEGFVPKAVPRTSLLDLRDEFEASLQERISLTPGEGTPLRRAERSDLHSAETIQSPPSSGSPPSALPTSTPPRSQRAPNSNPPLSPRAPDSNPHSPRPQGSLRSDPPLEASALPSDPPPSEPRVSGAGAAAVTSFRPPAPESPRDRALRWGGPLLVAAVGVAVGLWMLQPPAPAPKAATATTDHAPAPSTPSAPESAVAPAPSAAVAASAPSASAAPSSRPVTPIKKATAAGKAPPQGDHDLGASRD